MTGLSGRLGSGGSAQAGEGARAGSQLTHVCLPGAAMRCFSFIKTVMILFNLLIFVSAGLRALWGSPPERAST